MTTEQDIETKIKAKGLNFPRLTPADIDAAIVHAQYHVFPGTTMTVCCLTLKNGFSVTGENACVSRESWDPEMGRLESYKKAREKVWELEGYLLKEREYRFVPLKVTGDVS